MHTTGLSEVSSITAYAVSYPISDLVEVMNTVGFEGGSHVRIADGEVEHNMLYFV